MFQDAENLWQNHEKRKAYIPARPPRPEVSGSYGPFNGKLLSRHEGSSGRAAGAALEAVRTQNGRILQLRDLFEETEGEECRMS
jgi:hypothetical protein